MRLSEALDQIAEIRLSIARTQLFRGYRAATTAFSAVMALAAAAVQRFWIGESELSNFYAALWVWLAAAAICLAVVGSEMALRYRRNATAMQREMILAAVEQFAPCLVAGALFTFAVTEWAGKLVGILPAIWCMLFGLGVMASRRVLPKAVFVVGAWYLLAGLWCLGTLASMKFSTQMAVAFGGGQALAAIVLYWTLEREHGRA